MKKPIYLMMLTACFALLAAAPARANEESLLEGYWLTENKRAVVEIDDCDGPNGSESLCGEIHWIIAGGMVYDTKNPDLKKRGRPLCDLDILWGFRQESTNSWVEGSIYKADEGDTYNAQLELKSPDRLNVRGYVGVPMLGKSQSWTRVNERDYAECKEPKEKWVPTAADLKPAKKTVNE